MSENKTISYIFVTVQIVLIMLILFTGPLIPSNPFYFSGVIVGGFVMLWSLWTMRLSNLNVMPELKKECKLVTWGPYKYVRHPMYSGGLLIMLMLVLNNWTLLRFGYWLALVIDLHFKLRLEEKLLAEKFSEYNRYQQTTKYLIPFIY